MPPSPPIEHSSRPGVITPFGGGPKIGRQPLITQDGIKPIRIAQGERPGVTGEGKQPVGETHASTEAGGEKAHQVGEVPDAVLLFYNALLAALVMVIFAVVARRRLERIPRGTQNIAEWMVESLNEFTVGVIGPGGEKFTPLVGTIFIYIFLMNLMGLIPGLHSPTTNLSTTLALGVVVFLYSEFHGVRSRGLGGHIKHFMGPMPAMAPLLFPVELISEFIRPFTLAIRLFGNIFGEDVIIAVLAGLGAASIATKWIPFQFIVLLLALLTSLVQAMVFAILTCVYISLASSHDEEGHGEEGSHEPAHARATGH